MSQVSRGCFQLSLATQLIPIMPAVFAGLQVEIHAARCVVLAAAGVPTRMLAYVAIQHMNLAAAVGAAESGVQQRSVLRVTRNGLWQ
jgi:hypothetical protein